MNQYKIQYSFYTKPYNPEFNDIPSVMETSIYNADSYVIENNGVNIKVLFKIGSNITEIFETDVLDKNFKVINVPKPVVANVKWYDKTWVVVVLCIFFFPVGLYALWKNQYISQGWKTAITVFFSILIIGDIGKNRNDSSLSVIQPETPKKYIGIGQILHTDYFDVIVNEVSLKREVNTGNQFSDLKPEQGRSYLVINATFKNIDSESRMLIDGSVWINYNNKDYEFDKSETIMLEGWGLLLDQINPLTTKTTNLVYKIPEEVKEGVLYWQPGRANKDQKILLSKIKSTTLLHDFN